MEDQNLDTPADGDVLFENEQWKVYNDQIVSKYPVEYAISVADAVNQNSRKLADMEDKTWVDGVMLVEAYYWAAEAAGKHHVRNYAVFWEDDAAFDSFEQTLSRKGRQSRDRETIKRVQDMAHGVLMDEGNLFVLVRLAEGHAEHFPFKQKIGTSQSSV